MCVGPTTDIYIYIQGGEGCRGCENWFSMLRALPGMHALGTWWLSNMMCCGVVVSRNSLFGHVTTSFGVVQSHFEGVDRGRFGQNRGRFQAPILGKWSRWP
jgi:hypothetical protein